MTNNRNWGGRRKGAGPPCKLLEPQRVTVTLEAAQVEWLRKQAPTVSEAIRALITSIMRLRPQALEGKMKVKKLVVVEKEVEHTEIDPMEPAPDGYRGDMSCLRVVPPYRKGERVNPPSSGHDAWEVLDPDGEVVGVVEWWYGSNGRGKDAAARFYPKV